MKRVLRLVALTFMVSLATFTAKAEVVGFGLSGGTTHANFSLKGYDGAVSNNTGWQVGASASITVPFLSLTPEVWYMTNKFSVSNSLIAGGAFDVTARSVNMPIIAGFTVFGPLKLELGPSFSLYDKAMADFAGGESDVDLGGVRSKVGYVAGAKLTLMGKIILGARFNGQFGSCTNDFDSGVNYKVRNYSYSFSVGYKL